MGVDSGDAFDPCASGLGLRAGDDAEKIEQQSGHGMVPGVV